MIVSANIIDGYAFQITKSDEGYIPDRFKSELTTGKNGAKFRIVEFFPETVFINIPYPVGLYTFTGKRTYTPKSKFYGLYEHGFSIDAEFGTVAPLSQLKIEKPYNWIKPDNGQFVANHIPQLFGTLQGLTIVGVSGEFNWRNRTFTGYIYTGEL